MPYKDPDKQRQAARESARRRRAAKRKGKVAQVIAERDADVPKVLPEPPDEDELVRLLGVQARLGHVQAAKLLLDRIERNKSVGSNEDPFASFDELAQRRTRGA